MRLSEPFATSRGGVESSTNVFVRLAWQGYIGYGEASADPFTTGETAASVVAALDLLLLALTGDPFGYRSVIANVAQSLPGNFAAKASLDIALHDLVAKMLGIPLYKLLGVDPSRTCELCYTIGLYSIDSMVAEAVAASSIYKTIKVKLGSTYDADIVREVCSAVHVPVRVDVNGHWSAPHTLEMIDRVLVPCGVVLLEQPVAAYDFEGLKVVHDRSPIPVIVDESLYGSEGFARIADRCGGIDVKLMRCGGIQAALQLIASARSFGLKVMLGCMIESSLAITAGATLSALADYADLDLYLRLANDPFEQVRLENGRFALPNRAGLGLEPSENAPVWH